MIDDECAYANIPRVEVDSEGGYKFVIAAIGDAVKGRKTVIWACERCNSHQEIINHFELKYDVASTCMGGGDIRVHPNQQIVEISGCSGSFGLPDYGLTKLLLEDSFRGWEVKVDIE